MTLEELLHEIKGLEEKELESYKKLLKKLKDPEYADLRNFLLKLTIDETLHKHISEALEKAYREVEELVREYTPEEEVELGTAVLFPGVPTIILPREVNAIGTKIPTDEILEEYFGEFPGEPIVPAELMEEIKEKLREYIKNKEALIMNYEKLSEKAKHPVLKGIAKDIKNNKEQHKKMLEKLLEHYKS
ncbi:hypothetical protein OCC_04405 [Thermococcus litoralis DSM 5473]|uniref:Ferritin-like diiron domain-containing protein n=1 Tax=Thermococcus litoralis (strain ATCC 51850 / DSM 5473 / JCM 8560 / NS-C) TaxID=523849 RepID=H3ZPM5_THELN|nr:hypothetical protein [Thermococcus litoralis]EHR78069.1 hypothetical protein OCC_04405 [Thermococcus litoralis DSM 5473]